jgi:ubiquinone biosynthesis protein UbiJ
MKPLLFHTASVCVNAILANSPEASQALEKLQAHCKEPTVKTAPKNKDVRFNRDLQIAPIGDHGGSQSPIISAVEALTKHLQIKT